ncbi:aluminum-activated malate transporter 9-like protein [Carex littledalei]|uniref:Aluminum-activated malate transporter 9-like protein n=1 Tax=Carex littledalei TaxID=544730 RepID=A0A833RQJ1_9POAL|nr:aluminum-activated malate transporter 9-like protein [Carex littledalei]
MHNKHCIRIDVTLSPSTVLPEFVRKPRKKERFIICRYIRDLWQFAKEDKHGVAFSLKVGLAMIIVSLLILISQPYEVFGTNIIYAILTVAVMFEYTVGATLNRGFNRAAGTLVAGTCALMVIQIILVSAHAAEPYIIGASIFLVAVVTSFMKIWPPLVPYEHCFRVTLFTYCLIIISAYRNSNPVFTALTRLYCIAIGASIAVIMNVLVCPIWAGEQLHNEFVASFHSVAESLEECVKKYLDANCSGHIGFPQFITDEPSFQKCKATMNSSARIDFLANSAKWEPPHGRFRLFYPWPQYVKVGSVLRHCAYEVMALHGCIHSKIQEIYCMKLVAEPEISEAASRATELLCQLANNLSEMKHNPVETINILKSVHGSIYRLQQSGAFNSIQFTTLRNSFPLNLTDYHTMPKTNSCTNALLKEARRLNSWPSINSHQMEDARKIDRGKILRRTEIEYPNSMEALSSRMFVSLLIEFVVKLDHLVDAVDELFKLAKFDEHVV